MVNIRQFLSFVVKKLTYVAVHPSLHKMDQILGSLWQVIAASLGWYIRQSTLEQEVLVHISEIVWHHHPRQH